MYPHEEQTSLQWSSLSGMASSRAPPHIRQKCASCLAGFGGTALSYQEDTYYFCSFFT